jgi:2-oxo-4-hydroxy-4-carboxy-5-ureidoimidazoline decarboxylase
MERWRRIDEAAPAEARALLRLCCGSQPWIDRMLARRPFATRDAVVAAAREEWFALPPDEWRAAFTHHPRIGDVESLRRRFAETGRLSDREQAGVAGASHEVLAALAVANRAYEARFGHTFIVCATGRSAGEMLSALQARLENDPETELGVAAEEHAKIVELRLLSE